MNRKNVQSYQMLTRVAEFAASNVGLFPKESAAAEILDALKSGVGELSEKASAQISAETAMRSSQNARSAARDRLKDKLSQADRIARLLNSDRFRFPSGRTDQALIHSGRAFVEDTRSMTKDFARHGVGPEEVSGSVDVLEGAIRDYSKAKAARSAAIEKSGKVLEESMIALQRFDTLVASFLSDDAEANAAYNIARAVQRTKAHRTTSKEAEVAPESSVVPAAPAAPAVLANAATA